MNEIAKQKIGKLIGIRINSALAAKNITQKELAEKTNILPGTISYFCAGSRVPNADQLISIAKALSVSSDYLYGLTDSMSTDVNFKAIADYTGLSDNVISLLHDDDISIREVLNLLAKSSYSLHLAHSILHYIRSDTTHVYAMDANEVLAYSHELNQAVNNERDGQEVEKNLEEYKLDALTFKTGNARHNLLRTIPIGQDFWNAVFLKYVEEDLKSIKEELRKL